MRSILIIDTSLNCEPFRLPLQQHGWAVQTLIDGKKALQTVLQLQPQIILVADKLGSFSGFDFLKTIKSDPKTQQISVIILADHGQEHQRVQALASGAMAYLTKPCDVHWLCHLLQQECPFYPQTIPTPVHLPSSDSYLKFWGTRGSIPTSGTKYMQYGGHSSCVEVRSGRDLVIIDAGSGIRDLGHLLQTEQVKSAHLFIGHTHWDHIMGFPFFAPVYDPQFELHIWAERDIKQVLTGMLDPEYFPVRLEEMPSHLFFHELQDNVEVAIGSITLSSCKAFHPGATLCFKLKVAGKTIGYCSDNEVLQGHLNPSGININFDDPTFAPYLQLFDFYKGCDLLIHEAQYFPAEYEKHIGWGHSSLNNAAILAAYCQPKEWIVTHHDPMHTDDILRLKLDILKRLVKQTKYSGIVSLAHDGRLYEL